MEMNGAGGHPFFHSVGPVVDSGGPTQIKGRSFYPLRELFLSHLFFWGGVVSFLYFEVESLEGTQSFRIELTDWPADLRELLLSPSLGQQKPATISCFPHRDQSQVLRLVWQVLNCNLVDIYLSINTWCNLDCTH